MEIQGTFIPQATEPYHKTYSTTSIGRLLIFACFVVNHNIHKQITTGLPHFQASTNFLKNSGLSKLFITNLG